MLHEKEKVGYETKYESLFQNYVDKQVNEIFKMSLLEYLDLPSYISSVIDKICINELKKRSSVLSSIESEQIRNKKN